MTLNNIENLLKAHGISCEMVHIKTVMDSYGHKVELNSLITSDGHIYAEQLHFYGPNNGDSIVGDKIVCHYHSRNEAKAHKCLVEVD